MAAGATGALDPTGRSSLRTAAMLSAPQMPHPVRPVSLRERDAMVSSHSRDTAA
jgi:hypothetical protein